jgi:hypothetical protein
MKGQSPSAEGRLPTGRGRAWRRLVSVTACARLTSRPVSPTSAVELALPIALAYVLRRPGALPHTREFELNVRNRKTDVGCAIARSALAAASASDHWIAKIIIIRTTGCVQERSEIFSTHTLSASRGRRRRWLTLLIENLQAPRLLLLPVHADGLVHRFTRTALSGQIRTRIRMKVDTDKFLTELNKLYERNKQQGSVYVTMKRSERARKAASV